MPIQVELTWTVILNGFRELITPQFTAENQKLFFTCEYVEKILLP